MYQIEQVVDLVEKLVVQLEGLKYTKNSMLAAKLVGGIEVGINISQVASDRWNTRVSNATLAVMAHAPKPVEIKEDNLKALQQPILPPTPPPAPVTLGLPQIETSGPTPQVEG
jgi:hypothetical protein